MQSNLRTLNPLPSDDPAVDWSEPATWVYRSADAGKAIEEAKSIRGAVAASYGLRTALHGSPILHSGFSLESIDPMHLASLKTGIEEEFPRSVNPGLHEHLDLAGVTARTIVEQLRGRVPGVLPPVAAETASYLNDIGKLSGVFRYFLNDVLGDAMLSRIGVRSDITAAFQPLQSYIGPFTNAEYRKKNETNAAQGIRQYADRVLSVLTPPQKIWILSDVLGRRSKEVAGALTTFDEMLAYHSKTRSSPDAYEDLIKEKALWPAEIYAYNHMAGWSEGWAHIYRTIRDDIESIGIDLGDIRSRVADHYPLEK